MPKYVRLVECFRTSDRSSSDDCVRVRDRVSFVNCVLLAVNILVMCVISYLSGELVGDTPTESNTGISLEEVCVPCADISLFAAEEHEIKKYYTKNVTSGNETCCTTNITDLVYRELMLLLSASYAKTKTDCRNIFNKKSERTSRLNIAQGKYEKHFCDGRIRHPDCSTCAQVNSVIQTPFEDNSPLVALTWNLSMPRSFIGNNVTYTDGKFSVDEDGYYFIYALVTFRTAMKKGGYPTFNTYVFKSTNEGQDEKETIVLKASETFCKCEENQEYSISIGSQLFISKTEKVFLKVSDPSLLNYEKNRVIFGFTPG